MQVQNFLIVGDSGVGKTAFLKRMETGEFVKKHVPTRDVTRTMLEFPTNYGNIQMNMWETPYFAEFGNTISGAIIMFDVTNKQSYASVPNLYEYCKTYTSNIVLCGNKCDDQHRTVMAKNILFHRKHGMKYCDISARSNYNFEKPYLVLLQNLYGSDLTFVESEPLEIPEVPIDDDFTESYARELCV